MGIRNHPLVGKRVRLVRMDNDHDPIEPGTEGTTIFVYAPLSGEIDAIGVRWDNGRTLNLLPDHDKWEVLD